MMKAEHFIIGGAQRSGTSYLYRLLEQHPDICMAKPLRPEPKYFLDPRAVDKGYPAYLAAHFSQHAGEPLLGEKSTSYIEREDAAKRIHGLLPDARLVFMLREPAERAWSNWCFSRDQCVESLDFADALDAEPERLAQWDQRGFSVCPHAYVSRGFYARQLDPWVATFPRQHIRLMTSESLFRDPATLSSLLRWLGVDPEVPIRRSEPRNASRTSETPEDLLQALRARYAKDRERLADEWQLDTSTWPA